VIAPAVGVVARQVDPSFATTFRPGDADAMVEAIKAAARDLLSPEASAAARAAAERYGPADMSRDFAELLRTLLD
jgi:glycosyltransferase involved in cell wall biosynthesis